MRGKLGRREDRSGRFRLIPAHAGKTVAAVSMIVAASAHPRACGENASSATDVSTPMGSSPRMRGKHPRRHADISSQRLIPAHAGKTLAKALGDVLSQAHPRACGENPSTIALVVSAAGSSPRMRGKPLLTIPSTHSLRLIPAHAGKTLNDLEF